MYVALFSASLFALLATYASFDPAALARSGAWAPPRGLAVFMFLSGLVTLGVWLVAPLAALVQGGVPQGLDGHTTLVTTALDVAIIVPTAFLAGAFVLRRDPRGLLLAGPLLVLEVMSMPMLAAQTVSQLSVGVRYTVGEMVGPFGGFLVLAAAAIWFLTGVLRPLPGRAVARPQGG